MLGIMETDRRMWFSIWFLASIVTFGFTFFPMFYYMIDRRNRHFARHKKLEEQIAAFLKSEEEKVKTTWNFPQRNAKLWAISIVFIFPIFVISYFLSKDLLLHEKRQEVLLSNILPHGNYSPQQISIKKCALITIATLGVGVVYWLHKILNMYNIHFEEQRRIENEIARLMEEEHDVKSL